VISIGLLATIKTLGTSNSVTRSLSEKEIAVRAAMGKIAEMDSQTFAQIFADYDANPANDPLGAGTAPGQYFAVSGLSPQKGFTATQVGKIVFPQAGTQLREDVVNSTLGMPCDLNGDKVIDSNDHSADYVRLPVEIQISWAGAEGNQTITIPAILTGH
jgi:hypothetical protein